ncbi:tryptophan synthase beta subunit-like PLP-dependent enzyme [Clavulina sp. PMI_390]|nr:tryptophan synthase beta subunit-like PLP-dependent enzyme [Clavulina sp. PMI_390]
MQNVDVPNPWQKTPLIYSDALSARLDADVYLKLEHIHPGYSFKQRSVGLLAREEVKKHGHTMHLVIASGGNAALAAAHAAQQLGVPCTVFIPIPSYKASIAEVLERFGAKANGVGETYAEAQAQAEEYVANHPNAVLVHPYDDPLLWQGASTLLDEIAEQLPEHRNPPNAIVCCVGGGSLINGIMIGCERQKWNDTRIVAVETVGSDTLYHTTLASEDPSYKPREGVSLVKEKETGITKAHCVPTSRATSLGASYTASGAARRVLEKRAIDKNLVTVVDVPDELAMAGCLRLADDHKTLVELAAGSTLSVAYEPSLFNKVFPPIANPTKGWPSRRTLVFIVCGGFKISVKDLASYQEHLASCAGTPLDVWVDGENLKVETLAL